MHAVDHDVDTVPLAIMPEPKRLAYLLQNPASIQPHETLGLVEWVQSRMKPLTRAQAPQTSHEAASKINVTETMQAVLDVMRKTGPISDENLVLLYSAMSTKKQSSSGIRSRRSTLEKLGLVVRAGRMRNKNGNWCTLWEAK